MPQNEKTSWTIPKQVKKTSTSQSKMLSPTVLPSVAEPLVDAVLLAQHGTRSTALAGLAGAQNKTRRSRQMPLLTVRDGARDDSAAGAEEEAVEVVVVVGEAEVVLGGVRKARPEVLNV